MRHTSSNCGIPSGRCRQNCQGNIRGSTEDMFVGRAPGESLLWDLQCFKRCHCGVVRLPQASSCRPTTLRTFRPANLPWHGGLLHGPVLPGGGAGGQRWRRVRVWVLSAKQTVRTAGNPAVSQDLDRLLGINLLRSPVRRAGAKESLGRFNDGHRYCISPMPPAAKSASSHAVLLSGKLSADSQCGEMPCLVGQDKLKSIRSHTGTIQLSRLNHN